MSYFTNKKLSLLIANSLIGIIVISYVFSSGVIFWFFFTCLLWIISSIFIKFRFFPILLWLSIIIILYMNEKHGGYRFTLIHEKLQFLDDIKESEKIRWHVLYNITLLRIISFFMDKYWSIHNIDHNKQNEKQDNKNEKISFKNRTSQPQPLLEYNFLNYIAYLVYVPLFISGPIITFNAFISQIKIKQQTYSRKQVIVLLLRNLLQVFLYGVRVWLIDFFFFEIFTHINFANAFAKVEENHHLLGKFTVFQFYFTGFFNLVFIWFKYLNIWRISRFFALLDGIETVENMNRCICNNYNFQGFWRSWHRSFNQWLIRYIYIPLGGVKHKLLNMWVVFLFVALWHDINLNLIIWALGICFALIPEILISNYFNQKITLWQKWWWKYVCSLGGILYINLMILANLIAFGKGLDQISELLYQFVSIEGVLVICYWSQILLWGTLAMFYIRDQDEANF